MCQNGGTCVNTVGGYHCICVNGWEGEHCQINHNDCVGTVCYNGGTCHDRVASFYCECPIGKTGTRQASIVFGNNPSVFDVPS